MARISSINQNIKIANNEGFNSNKEYLPTYAKKVDIGHSQNQNVNKVEDIFGSLITGVSGIATSLVSTGISSLLGGSGSVYSEDLVNVGGAGGISGIIQNIIGSTKVGSEVLSVASTIESAGQTFFDLLTMFSIGTNILNDYVNYTYHWVFFAANETADYAWPEEGVIIAESGVTGLNIKEVMMENVVNPSYDGKSNTHLAVGLDIIMMIAEPAGISLADNMIAAGSAMGSEDWAKQPYYMCVSFRGYNATSGAPDTALPMLRKTWKVVVKKISSTTTQAGTDYTLYMTIINNEGKQSAIARLDTNVRFVATTVGDCVQQLLQQLNTNQDKEVKSNYINKVTYNIQFVQSNLFSSDPMTWEIIRSEDNPTIPADSLIANKERASQLGGDGSKEGAKEMPFPEGTRIEEILELVIAATKEGRALAGIKHDSIQGTDDPTGASDNITDPTQNIHHFIRVEPKIILEGYNTDYNDYDRSVIYYVHFQSNTTTVYEKESMDYKLGAGRMQRLMEISQYVVRRYDYLFTGMNTEVLDLQIHLDNYYAAIFPVAGGFYNHALNRDGKHLNDKKKTDMDAARGMGDSPGANPESDGGGFFSDVLDGAESLVGSLLSPIYQLLRPRYIQDNNAAENNIHKSAETQWNRGRAVMGAVLNQKMGRSVSPALLSIELQIRGDPYWFGCDTLEQEMARGGPVQIYGVAGSTANYHDHSQLFLLAFDMPREYNKTTGLYSSNKANAMQGIYQVLRVKSSFKDGKFTQTLVSVRDIQTEIRFGI